MSYQPVPSEVAYLDADEGPARLENVADLLVGMLEARRDHKIEKRAGATEAP